MTWSALILLLLASPETLELWMVGKRKPLARGLDLLYSYFRMDNCHLNTNPE
jgi:hypothetical protein